MAEYGRNLLADLAAGAASAEQFQEISASPEILKKAYAALKPEERTDPAKQQDVYQQAAAMAGQRGLGSLAHDFQKQATGFSELAKNKKLNDLAVKEKEIAYANQLLEGATDEQSLKDVVNSTVTDPAARMQVEAILRNSELSFEQKKETLLNMTSTASQRIQASKVLVSQEEEKRKKEKDAADLINKEKDQALARDKLTEKEKVDLAKLEIDKAKEEERKREFEKKEEERKREFEKKEQRLVDKDSGKAQADAAKAEDRIREAQVRADLKKEEIRAREERDVEKSKQRVAEFEAKETRKKAEEAAKLERKKAEDAAKDEREKAKLAARKLESESKEERKKAEDVAKAEREAAKLAAKAKADEDKLAAKAKVDEAKEKREIEKEKERIREFEVKEKRRLEEDKVQKELAERRLADAEKKAAAGGKGGKGGKAASGREARYADVVAIAGNEASVAINNLVNMPMTVSSGIMGGKSKTSWFNAPIEALKNSVTSEDSQRYNAEIDNVGKYYAKMISGGLPTTKGDADQFSDQFRIKPGDKELTKLTKLAQMRQTFERAAEIKLKSRATPEEQRGMWKDWLAQVKKDIPLTVNDVNKLANESKTGAGKKLISEVLKSSSAKVKTPEKPVGDWSAEERALIEKYKKK